MALPPLSPMDGEILDGIWYVHLRRARCAADVVASVREFLDALTAHEAARLREPRVLQPEDIPRLSTSLAHTYEALPADSADRLVYIRTIALLCYASDRLSQVPATPGRTRQAQS